MQLPLNLEFCFRIDAESVLVHFVVPMRDLSKPGAMWLKAVLLLAIGVVSAVLIVADNPGWKTAVLLALTIWGFCRAYYFAFYVIEHYVDPNYRFSGLWSFCRYCLGKRGKPSGGK